MKDFIAQVEEWERIDSPWLFEKPKEPARQPIFGAGGKFTGKFKPTGTEAMKQMEIQMGREATPTGARPQGAQIAPRADMNEQMRQRQQAAVDAILGPLNAFADEMERKWGTGRLKTLVPEEWALKFHTAADKLKAAIAATDMAAIREKAEVMRRGWVKLDQLATEVGAEPWTSPDIWEVRAPGGKVYAIARTDFDQWSAEQKDGVAMYTLAEVALILEAWDRDVGTSMLKEEFPDARLTKAQMKPGAIEFDDIPF